MCVQHVEAWISDLYASIDYEQLLSAEEVVDSDLDDVRDDFIYGESSMRFFMDCLETALCAVESPARGFVDLGGGKGQLALAAARDPRFSGPCVSLELVPELHGMCAAAVNIAAGADPAFGRVVAKRGSIYDLPTLDEVCGPAAVVYAYATKFESGDGVRVERLSEALAASALTRGAVVVSVNRKLCEEHGWVEVAPPQEGDAPDEDGGRAVAHFWRRREPAF